MPSIEYNLCLIAIQANMTNGTFRLYLYCSKPTDYLLDTVGFGGVNWLHRPIGGCCQVRCFTRSRSGVRVPSRPLSLTSTPAWKAALNRFFAGEVSVHNARQYVATTQLARGTTLRDSTAVPAYFRHAALFPPLSRTA